MIQKTAALDIGKNTNNKLVEISIVLVADQNVPSILNPDMLRYRGIVDEALNLSAPPLSTPAYSQVAYERGIVISAEPNRFIFLQNGSPLDEENCAITSIAERFVGQMSHVQYNAVGINAKIFQLLGDNPPYRLIDFLIGSGDWASFKDVLPEIEIKSVYHYEGRRITLDVGGTRATRGGVDKPSYLHQANVHRDIRAKDEQERIRKILDIIGGWRKDVSDINDLVQKYQSRVAA